MPKNRVQKKKTENEIEIDERGAQEGALSDSDVVHFRRFKNKYRADDEKKERIAVTLSSDAPIDLGYTTEILVHEEDSVNLERAAEGIPLLADHSPRMRDHVGRVYDLRIEDGRLKGEAVFHETNELSKELKQSARTEGGAIEISISYEWDRIEIDEEAEVTRVTRWTLLEASIVAIPADINAGFNRSKKQTKQTIIKKKGNRNMPPGNENQETDVDTGADIDIKKLRDSANQSAAQRSKDNVREIMSAAEACDMVAAGVDAIKRGITPDEFNRELLAKINERKKEPAKAERSEDPDIGLTDQETQQFSFARALAYLANPTDPNMRERAAFEIEVSAAAKERYGKNDAGITVPTDVLSRSLQPMSRDQYDAHQRTLSVGTAAAGGDLVATDLLSTSFIDVLRKRLAVFNAGATVLADLVGDVAIPRQTGASSGSWIGSEGGDAGESDPTFDQVPLTPKTAGAYSEYTNKLLLQSSIGIEALIRSDLAKGLISTLDAGALYGSGAAGQPTGVTNATGINTTTFGAADPTFAEIVAMETEVAADDADIGSLSYLANAAMRGHFKTTEKFTGTGMTLWEQGGTVNGARTAISNQVATGDVIYGSWEEFIIGLWGGLDLLIDPYTKSLSKTVRVIAHQSVDYAVRRPQAFCVSNDGV